MTPRSCLRWKPTGKVFNSVGLRWVPTGKIFTSSTTTVESEPPHGSNTYITNLHECIQTLDSSAGTSINVKEKQTLDLNAGTPFNLKKERIKPEHSERYSLVFTVMNENLSRVNIKQLCGRYKRRCCSLIPAELNSLPHAHSHAQTTKAYYKHQDSRIKEAQELKTKTSVKSDIQDIPLRYQVYQGRLLASF
ncbi:hypothetical protein Tco_0307041 [Tanacetum coccineum]